MEQGALLFAIILNLFGSGLYWTDNETICRNKEPMPKPYPVCDARSPFVCINNDGSLGAACPKLTEKK